MSLSDADPDFLGFIEKWTAHLEGYPGSRCNDVVVKEMMTINPAADDYEKWRSKIFQIFSPACTSSARHRK